VTNAPGTPGDWAGLYDANGNALQWAYLNDSHTMPATGTANASVSFMLPATPGTFHARLFNGNYTLVATSGTITTTAASVALSASNGFTGGSVTAIVSNAPGTTGDWVGLYDSGGAVLSWRYLNGTQVKPLVGVSSASVTFTLPAIPGTYHVMLFNAAYVLVATSGTITSIASLTPTVTLGATSGVAGGTVTATVVNGPGNAGDWAGLYDSAGNAIQWQYLNGTHTLPTNGATSATLTFVLPATLGAYHVRLFNASYVLIATSGTISTTAPTVLPTVTLDVVSATVGSTARALVANGPGAPGDWVGLFDANGNAVQWEYLNGSHSLPAIGVSSASVPFVLPTPGTYQMRLFNSNYVQIATSDILTVF